MQKTINGATLRKMFVTAYSLLEENKNNVDALNVTELYTENDLNGEFYAMWI